MHSTRPRDAFEARSLLRLWLRRRCEPVDGGDHRLLDAGLAGAMAGVVDQGEVAAGPHLTQLPRDVERRAQVQPAVDEDSSDPGQPAGVAQESAVLEEARVVPV